MNIKQLREAIETMPDHWPVTVAMTSNEEHGGGCEIDYLCTVDCVTGNFPTQGNMAVIELKP